MGASESIHNDADKAVQVWFQLQGGATAGKNLILYPNQTSPEQDFPLGLLNQVCVRYKVPIYVNGVAFHEETPAIDNPVRCKSEFSPGVAGKHVTYEVSDIIGKGVLLTESEKMAAEAKGFWKAAEKRAAEKTTELKDENEVQLAQAEVSQARAAERAAEATAGESGSASTEWKGKVQKLSQELHSAESKAEKVRAKERAAESEAAKARTAEKAAEAKDAQAKAERTAEAEVACAAEKAAEARGTREVHSRDAFKTWTRISNHCIQGVGDHEHHRINQELALAWFGLLGFAILAMIIAKKIKRCCLPRLHKPTQSNGSEVLDESDGSHSTCAEPLLQNAHLMDPEVEVTVVTDEDKAKVKVKMEEEAEEEVEDKENMHYNSF